MSAPKMEGEVIGWGCLFSALFWLVLVNIVNQVGHLQGWW